MENFCINGPKVLFIEPFYGGSHKELIDTLSGSLDERGIKYTLVTLSARKWHWRARCSALILCDRIPRISTQTVLFCSSVLNLAELLGLRPDLCGLKKIVYFHENQLIYPVQQIKDRDIQYAYNEITTRSSFLESIIKILKIFPDNKPMGIRERIEGKSEVLYFPVKFPLDIQMNLTSELEESILHIVWPHRWEFDKGPDDFFNVMLKLKQSKCKFKLSVLGQTYTDVSEIFNKTREELNDNIVHFGYVESKRKYLEVLNSSHIVVSTAKHEFFGVSIMEATYCGCLPLLPRDLVYPEIYPTECLYKDLEELYCMLEQFCLHPKSAVDLRSKLRFDFEKYSSEVLLPDYVNKLEINVDLRYIHTGVASGLLLLYQTLLCWVMVVVAVGGGGFIKPRAGVLLGRLRVLSKVFLKSSENRQ
ncbi:glycosyltransferase-like domain-containing protein 1 [Anoplophora glabripennis]|uniref:glycosyltransferase-like domain-containing protein 1 n=1 Tax=Anoplophora glabripennis TaxID=217634 RepID=UPI000874A6AC|nr:glycosyltransferase-like domain-containing protein 1 [Anoplophora glabripennis]